MLCPSLHLLYRGAPRTEIIQTALFSTHVASFSQNLYLNASYSVDDDQFDDAALDFTWTCIDEAGDYCESSSGSILNLDAFASGAILTVPADTLPIGKTMVKPGSRTRQKLHILTFPCAL